MADDASGGKGRRRREGAFPKGRPVDRTAVAEIRALLGDRPRRRDLLIEYLHLIQDRWNGLAARHLAALAAEMGLAQVEVYEVASFYAHFDLQPDGAEALPPLTVRICDGLPCTMAGAETLLAALARGMPEHAVRVVRAPCMGRCDHAPAAAVGHAPILSATAAALADAVEDHAHAVAPAEAIRLDAYRAGGGYRVLADLKAGTLSAEALIERMDGAALRGLGGAGFPTGRKWKVVRQYPGPRLMAVNADEGEPGTFKDRHIIETDPHRMLEGMLVGAHVVEATDIYLYLRDEYPELRVLLEQELAALGRAGLLGGAAVHLRRGAGAYICGEESAMLESIEGKRGLPRHKPPYPAEVGLFGRPTLIHNVETLYWIRDIVERDPDWFAAQGRRGRKGMRFFSVSGRVRDPGVKLAPAGISARELIDEFAGGMADGHQLYAYLPGGASGGILPARMADLPLDFGTLEPHGCFIGSAAVVVLSHQDRARDAAINLMRFFADESCGQCTPCRAGTEKALTLMDGARWDRALLKDLSTAMRDASICGLGQAAPNPMDCVVRYFPEELA